MGQKIKYVAMLAVMGSLPWSHGAWAAAAAGYVRLIKGDVMILDKDAKVVADSAGKRSRKVVAGAEFYVGETIRTGPDGRVKIEMVEGKNEVVLGSNTALLIERAPTVGSKDKGTSLSLARGEVRSTVNERYSGKGSDVYEVKTPNAVAGVRGTIFLAKFDPRTAKSEVATERGLVAVRSATDHKEVMVAKGMFTAAVGAAPPAPAAPLSMNPDLEGSVKSLGGGDKESSKDSGSTSSDSGGDKKDAKSDSGSADSKSGDSKSGDSKGEAKAADGKSGDSSGGDKTADKGNNSSSDGKNSDSGTATAKSDGSGNGGGKDGGNQQQSSKATNTASTGGKDSSSESSVPLGREPVTSTADGGRVPASTKGSMAGVPIGTAPMPMNPPGPAMSPIAAVASTAINKTVSSVNTVTQTVNQTTQQIQHRTGTAIIKLQ